MYRRVRVTHGHCDGSRRPVAIGPTNAKKSRGRISTSGLRLWGSSHPLLPGPVQYRWRCHSRDVHDVESRSLTRSPERHGTIDGTTRDAKRQTALRDEHSERHLLTWRSRPVTLSIVLILAAVLVVGALIWAIANGRGY